jgi:hypothetical protein
MDKMPEMGKSAGAHGPKATNRPGKIEGCWLPNVIERARD